MKSQIKKFHILLSSSNDQTFLQVWIKMIKTTINTREIVPRDLGLVLYWNLRLIIFFILPYLLTQLIIDTTVLEDFEGKKFQ